jgi:uncharacterized protein (TIGR02391 family)
MANTEANGYRILQFLVELPRNTGRAYPADGGALISATNLSADEINDAVAILVEKGFVEWSRVMGTAPFDFGGVRITPRGRLEHERAVAGRSAPPGNSPVVIRPAVASRRLGLEGLHPAVLAAAGDLFTDGHYSQAIFEAFKAVEVRVRDQSGLPGWGQDLMARAFAPDAARIDIRHESGQSGADEQEGFKFLFMGAMRGIKNPKSHGMIKLTDTQRALEYLALASLLMRRLDDAESRDAT